ncbi:hypothetical protein NUW54_g14409 [Trametes sanguinea]|uniref:Uncharacterized protein n=1 Tax=Trametes sanguinea TaxID=158606 RepID=A0ACC1MCE7_9APHY|nr:hypothetical protein NUW54_g14409 [Trametes sanguinea]
MTSCRKAALTAPSVPQVVLETEYDNSAALSLYESLGFIREKRLYRFYLNGKDAFRLVLVVPPPDLDEDDQGSRKALPIRYLAPPRTMISIPPLPYDSDDEVSSR